MLAAIASLVLWISGCHAIRSQAVLPPRVSLGVLRHEYAATRSAKDPHNKALHSYLLNDAADRYAYELNQERRQIKGSQVDWRAMKKDTSARVEHANQYGGSIKWCEYDADWTAGSPGYEAYLSLWPDGPNAEEAWWRGRLRHKLNSCFDGEGSEEETVAFVSDYTEFLRRFPQGRHKREAAKLLKDFQADLDSYKRQQTH
jgi:hypothetical protein